VLQADVRERFLSEARLLRRIESRRVVRVHDVGVEDDRPYFVMDYVNGGTLADCVGTLGPGEAVRLSAEAAEAVQVLHEAGFMHRDIKPSNLLVDRTSEPVRVLVADLGSAKRLADATGYTVTIGTPAYMAPEQADGVGGFDGRADVYSLAIVTWELLTGSRPPVAQGPSARGLGGGRAARHRPGLLLLDRTDVNPQVRDVLMAALDPEPDGRPRDARAFGQALTVANAAASSTPRRSWPALGVWAVALVVFGLALVISWRLL
jgi:serine/threonine protein kinase